ncbi:MAG: hypothetical protein WBH47_27280 [Streptosporangiaceae bacterium]
MVLHSSAAGGRPDRGRARRGRPAHGRVLLRLARSAFPEIRAWTDDIVDARYDPRTKLLAANHGEPQRRAEWP